MQRKVYEALCGLNEGYEQVRRNLKILARHPGLQRAEVRRFERWAAEMCAATNSYLLEALGARETDQAGRLFVRRKARVYSGDVNGSFRRDVNKSERSDAGICNHA